jgi:hypothetical protein
VNGASPDELTEIDQRLAAWRQGDVAFPDEFVFLHLADLRQPLTEEAKELAAELDRGVHGVASTVDGVVVVSQTCDIVRACADRHFIEVCPLVALDEALLEDVKKRRRPAYAWIPLISADNALVADLDRVMTVEKAVVAKWARVPGWSTDEEARAFALALARKRARVAFPADFNHAVHAFHRRIREKNAKNSLEGRMLRSLREIRVRAAPSWDAPIAKIFLWFIKSEDPANLQGDWDAQLETWMRLIDWGGRFECDGFQACDLRDLTAEDYIESDQLDLDHLSTEGGASD